MVKQVWRVHFDEADSNQDLRRGKGRTHDVTVLSNSEFNEGSPIWIIRQIMGLQGKALLVHKLERISTDAILVDPGLTIE